MKNGPPKDIRVLIPGEWLIPLAASYWAPTKAGTDLDTGGAVVNEVNTCPQGACTLLWEQHWSSWQKCEHTDVWTRLYGLQGSSIITCGRLPHPLGGTLRFGLRSHQFPCWTPSRVLYPINRVFAHIKPPWKWALNPKLQSTWGNNVTRLKVGRHQR